MKKTLQICVLVALALIFTDARAQDVTAKEITDQAAKAVLDQDNIATANAAGIKGTLTAVKMSGGQKEDFKKGFYAGILELEVKGDYGNLKSGKFNLFFKDGGQGLKLYLEEKGMISGVFEVTQTTPENYQETKTGDKPMLDFPQPPAEEKQSRNFAAINRAVFSFSSFALLRSCKIYIRIYINGHRYWIWSGATRKCGTPAR